MLYLSIQSNKSYSTLIETYGGNIALIIVYLNLVVKWKVQVDNILVIEPFPPVLLGENFQLFPYVIYC